MGKCPLFYEGQPFGEVFWHEDGELLRVTARCPFEEESILRATVRGGNKKLYLGVMVPVGKNFEASKTVRASAYGDMFGNDPRGFVAKNGGKAENDDSGLPFEFSELAALGEKNSDSLVQKVFSSCGGLTCRKDGNTYYVAPAEIGGELGAAAFFRLLTFFERGGREYCVLKVGRSGEPQALEDIN